VVAVRPGDVDSVHIRVRRQRGIDPMFDRKGLRAAHHIARGYGSWQRALAFQVLGKQPCNKSRPEDAPPDRSGHRHSP